VPRIGGGTRLITSSLMPGSRSWPALVSAVLIINGGRTGHLLPLPSQYHSHRDEIIISKKIVWQLNPITQHIDMN